MRLRPAKWKIRYIKIPVVGTMKTVLLAGHAPARNEAWRDELLATGEWDVLGPVQSFASARVLLHRHDPDLLIAELRLVDGTVLDMIRMLRVGLAYLRTQVLLYKSDVVRGNLIYSGYYLACLGINGLRHHHHHGQVIDLDDGLPLSPVSPDTLFPQMSFGTDSGR